MSGRNLVNYYFILNVSPKASSEEIKQAYLKLVKAYHPDKNKGSRLAEKKFQQINSAWEVLKDADKRRLFDENLRKARILKSAVSPSPPKAGAAPIEKKKESKGIDIEVPLKLSLEELCQAKVKTISYLRPVNGFQENSRLKVQVPLGAKQGTRLLFKKKGGSEGRKNFGNLYVKISIKNHKIFKIMDNNSSDIMIEQPISFISAVQSNRIEVFSPYGFLSLKVKPPIKPGQILKVRNYGLRKGRYQKGDLFIKFFVEYPLENGDKIQQELLKMPQEKQKKYIERFKEASFIYPRVLKFQKKIQELKKEYYPDE